MSIDASRLTVILQGRLKDGPVDIAARAIESVRQHLPGAQIILSTTDDCTAVSFDGVQCVADASAVHFADASGNINNVNKLISTVANGLALATREYSLKLRTDHVLCSNALLALMGDEQPASLLGARIGVSNLFLRNPIKLCYLFHLSDTLQFGRTDDLRRLWNIGPLPAEFVYLAGGPRINPIGTFQGYTSFRLLPEQAILLRFLQTCGQALDLDHISHTRFDLFCAWEDLLLDNFEVHDWQSLGVTPPQRFLTEPYAPETILTGADLHSLRARRTKRHKAGRYLHLLLNKYLLCWFRRRWLVSVSSLLLFSFSPRMAIAARTAYRRFCEAGRT
ncbi:WavE lipopolysaccharide synthesis family protein [Pseudomonas sp. FP453]|jgi:hypothetical protein|uniref:WavE lipopolysaccharide synthesis family protein n=1 Tax=unclassified Pseudomonas TaxID=196821 RepID=UPI00034AAEF4|nr:MULTISPECIES: WavE lipopolysaccharide synthesis family protein [unclassified Pseudomonas]WLH90423.1 WavE lipopolysaccharide synthesis family protein [Pseudomonas sp. FP453]